MFPTQNLHYKHQQQRCYEEDGYGTAGCSGEIISYYGTTTGGSFDLMRKIEAAAGYECYSEVCLESSDLLVLAGDRMAEDGSRTSSVNETGSSSKLDVVAVQQADDHERDNIDHDDEKWLQLGLGSTSTTSELNPVVMAEQQQRPMPRRGTTGLVELDLLSAGTQLDVKPLAPIFHMTTEQFRPAPLRPPPPINYTHSAGTSFSNMPAAALLIQQQQRTNLINLSHHHHQPGPAEIVPWGSYSRPPPNLWNPTVASSSSSSVPLGSYISRSFQQYPNVVDTAGPSSDMTMMRVVDAPPRPHSGIWFVLQASQNQSKEPFLPQIPKSYLRIKDGRMTVRLLMKYLVNKLRLNSESEIEIRCKGQQVDGMLTLQDVRDNIWSSKDMVTLLPDSSTSDHVMILHYARSRITTTTTTITTSTSSTI